MYTILFKKWRYKRGKMGEKSYGISASEGRGEKRPMKKGKNGKGWKKGRWEGWFLREQILHKVINNGIQGRKGYREGLKDRGKNKDTLKWKDGKKDYNLSSGHKWSLRGIPKRRYIEMRGKFLRGRLG